MKLEDIIRCVGINPLYKGEESGEQYGMANAYIYIPYSKEIEKISRDNGYYYYFENCSVHGGITLSGISKISKYHCPYSRVLSPEEYDIDYIIIGWDTNHLNDNDTKWNYHTIIEENERLAKQIFDIINKELEV